MSVPIQVRERIRERLWATADDLNWASLSSQDKTRQYENWTQDEEIGGVLSRFIDKARVRVYIKDTLLKDYALVRLANHTRPFRVLGIAEHAPIDSVYRKPHGARLTDGRIITWGRADDWRTLITATFERCYVQSGSSAAGVVLLGSTGRWNDNNTRQMIEAASACLGIKSVIWLAH